MKVRYLIAIAFIVCPWANLHAKTYANRTFLTPRAPLDNMVLEQATWHHNLNNIANTDHGASIQVSALYQHSNNSGDLGKYFGYYAPHEGKFRDYINVVNYLQWQQAVNADDTYAEFIVHNTGGNLENFSGTIKFRPTQEFFSTRFDFYTDLSSLANGLFIQLSVPTMAVKNSLRLTQEGTITPITIAAGGGGPLPFTGKNLFDYFQGNVSNLVDNSDMQQRALAYAKMENNKSRAGIADLETKLGLALINDKNAWLKVGASMVTPTGNRPTGEFIFEPMCGNGQHWEFGGFVDTKCLLWRSYQRSVSFLANVSCSYGLGNTEKRTLAIQKDDGSPEPFSQYYVIGQRGLRYLFPFANVSTQELKVTPGIHCQALANLAFTFKNFAFDCGYNLFAKQRETVNLKYAWQDDMYAIAQDDYDTGAAHIFMENALAGGGAYDNTTIDGYVLGPGTANQGHPIRASNLDMRTVTTPAQVTHKFYGIVSHTTTWQTPLLFGLGGSYEFGTSNTNIDAYALWLTANLTF